MDRTVILLVLLIATIISWNMMTGPFNFLWLMMLVVDFWAIVAMIGYSMVLGLINAARAK